MGQKHVKTFIGFTVAGLAIAALIWIAGPDRIAQSFSDAEIPVLLAGISLAQLGLPVLGISWWLMIREVADYSLVKGLKVFYATMFANMITPLGQFGGEPFIAYILSRDSGKPLEECFGSILAADIINTVPFFTYTLAGSLGLLIYFPGNTLISNILKGIVGLLAVLISLFIVFRKRKDLGLKLLGWTGKRVELLLRKLEPGEFESGDEYMREKGENFYRVFENLIDQKPKMAKALAFSHLSELMGITGLYLILISLGFEPSFFAAMVAVTASEIGGYLPLPGGLGGIEAAMTGVLIGITPISPSIAAAAVLAQRIGGYWLTLAIGGYFASRISVEFTDRI